ncbi:MAG TPA: hypothetical protein VHY30_00110 [Verrucomicrobiae bacterium]|jgi:hypothetical protein|nr:hypothetical protein [Verrucomicrobiae bacterium]
MSSSFQRHPWVNVAVFENLNDGQALEMFLKNHRLEARTYDDKLFRCFLFLRPPRITYRVEVRGNVFRAATELLDGAPEATAILQRAIHCPSCGSLSVQYPQMTRKFILPTVMLHLGIIFRIIHHEAYCESCHHIWNLPDLGKNILAHWKRPAID